MRVTGTEWCGNREAPPLTHRVTYVQDDGVTRVFSTIDDGGFVGIGYPDEWHVIMRTKAARMFAWWILRLWVTNWFGLRERVYFRALHHKVGRGWRLTYKPNRVNKLTHRTTHEQWRKATR